MKSFVFLRVNIVRLFLLAIKILWKNMIGYTIVFNYELLVGGYVGFWITLSGQKFLGQVSEKNWFHPNVWLSKQED